MSDVDEDDDVKPLNPEISKTEGVSAEQKQQDREEEIISGRNMKVSAKLRSKSKTHAAQKVTANLANTNYDMVRQVCKELKLKITESPHELECNLLWFDCCPSGEVFSKLLPYQRVNHFPGTGQITRKDNLARNVNRMLRACSESKYNMDQLDVFPLSWVFPADLQLFRNYLDDCKLKRKKKRINGSSLTCKPTFIFKPISGARGEGIFVTQNPEEIPTHGSLLVQQYIPNPLLVDGFKFDLRLYVLITSCDPLRIYLFEDGLARLSTTAYKAPSRCNVKDSTMHLTNYSLNKDAENFLQTDDDNTGSKRTYRWLLEHLRETKNANTDALQQRIADAIIKTIIVCLPFIQQGYSTCRLHQSGLFQVDASSSMRSLCFEILGFDILLTSKLKPYIIEVNRAPSFTCDSQLDARIKHDVLYTALSMVHMQSSDRAKWVAHSKASTLHRLQQKTPSSAPPTQTLSSIDSCTSSNINRKKRTISSRRRAHLLSHPSSPTTKSKAVLANPSAMITAIENYAELGTSSSVPSMVTVHHNALSGKRMNGNSSQRDGESPTTRIYPTSSKREVARQQSSSSVCLTLDDGSDNNAMHQSKDGAKHTDNTIFKQPKVSGNKRSEEEFENQNKGRYSCIYPVNNQSEMTEYHQLIEIAQEVVRSSMGTFSRLSCQHQSRAAYGGTESAPSSIHTLQTVRRHKKQIQKRNYFATCSHDIQTTSDNCNKPQRDNILPALHKHIQHSHSDGCLEEVTDFLSCYGTTIIGIVQQSGQQTYKNHEVDMFFQKHRSDLTKYWLRTQSMTERHHVIIEARERILSSLARYPLTARSLRIITKVFDRVASNNSQALLTVCSLTHTEWRSIEPIMISLKPSPAEQKLCIVLVTLLRHVLLYLYMRRYHGRYTAPSTISFKDQQSTSLSTTEHSSPNHATNVIAKKENKDQFRLKAIAISMIEFDLR
eukprot:gene6091-7376_t